MLKRWCGNVYGTYERNYQTFDEIQVKTSLEGRGMPSNMATNTNHTTLLKKKCHKISPLKAFSLKFGVYLRALSARFQLIV